jgi:hypothetical protein
VATGGTAALMTVHRSTAADQGPMRNRLERGAAHRMNRAAVQRHAMALLDVPGAERAHQEQ